MNWFWKSYLDTFFSVGGCMEETDNITSEILQISTDVCLWEHYDSPALVHENV
jgi:hypothetical protein